MQNNTAENMAIILVPCLLVLYAAPVVTISLAALTGNLNGGNILGKWFVSLIASPDVALSLFHKVLMPITAGVTVATLWQARHARWTSYVVIGILITIALSIWLMVMFGITSIQSDMQENAGSRFVTTNEQFYTLASSFLGRIQETLSTYLLILLGLQSIPSPAKPSEEQKK